MWESPPSILVTRNPNWSQRLGTGTGCVKGRYEHPKYALPKVSCIVYLSDKIQGLAVFPSCRSVYGSRKVLLNKEVVILSGKNLTVLTSMYVGSSMVQEKSSSIRRSLSYRVKNLTVLTSMYVGSSMV